MPEAELRRRAARRPPLRRIARFVARPARERRLLIRALLAVAGMRLALSLLSFRTALGLVRRLGAPRRSGAATPPAAEIVRAVRTTSRLVPRATCLTQALTGRILLARAGHEADVRIGVRKHPERGFEAHAWLEHGGRIVLGELEDLGHFTPISSLERYLDRTAPPDGTSRP